MQFFEKNKVLALQIAAGAILAVILNWLGLPVWLVGAAVAGVVAVWTAEIVDAYDKHVAPRIKSAREEKD